jgi:hypothetical protein
MSDDRFDEWVREAAQDYNRPPDIPPRDAIWGAIQSRRSQSDAPGDRTPPVVAGALALHSRPRTMFAARPWMLAAAAMLLVAAGIGIGRLTSSRPVQGTTDVAGAQPAAQTPTPVTPSPNTATRVAVVQPAGQRSGEQATPSSGNNIGSGSTNAAATIATGYDVLAAQHLSAAEALLVSFRASEDTAMDAIMRRWARDLLSTTRLLADSPAGKDPVRRRLFNDLELVLVQLSQLPTHDATLDRELIDQAISRRQVITRIRTSIPPGFVSGT